ncbi:wiskott-Aldrich syndrome protein family member 3-like isoform X2 [Anneissia japonica]|uniref:wiskott-Aldrich syndrome protein family member 3-like isoform X2 n=1 Tax=Anneissia japonica TaxID=1529436 RepID=UPI0014257819|nr:wiskott-Aldrich syndrome protein family member 3-like isoform X2 [Anneissia japonica]
MPLIKRHVEPVHLSRTVISRGIKNELECVTNNTLSGVIRQLSNLSKHAEDIFGDLYQEANSVFIRANILQDRIDKLTVKVTKLDATQDPVLLQDIHLRKAYKSTTLMDQQVVAGHTMPSTMRELYMLCDKPPKLNLLTPYREDGREGLEFYTKPRYFFELWCEEQKKNISLLKQERRHRRKQRHPREKGIISNQPRAARTRKEHWEAMKHGADLRQHQTRQSDHHNMAPEEEFHEDTPVPNQTQIRDDRQAYSGSPYQDAGGLGRQEARRSAPNRPMAAPPPPPPQTMSNGGPPMNTGYQNEYNLQQHVPSPPEYPDAPPYQPQMISDQGCRLDLGHNDQQEECHQIPDAPPLPAAGYSYPEPTPMHNLGQSSYIPAPPPPPNIGFVPPPPPVPLGPAAQTGISSPAKVPAPPVKEEPEDNPRSDLLSAIRTGIKLREVDRTQAKKQNSDSTPNSVAAILARRLAVELSDSEDDSNTSSDWEEDDTSWD